MGNLRKLFFPSPATPTIMSVIRTESKVDTEGKQDNGDGGLPKSDQQ